MPDKYLPQFATSLQLATLLAYAEAWGEFFTSDHVEKSAWGQEKVLARGESMAGILLPIFASADEAFPFLRDLSDRARAIGQEITAGLDQRRAGDEELFKVVIALFTLSASRHGSRHARIILAILSHWFPEVIRVAAAHPRVQAGLAQRGAVIDPVFVR
jgi:hypothetical protein